MTVYRIIGVDPGPTPGIVELNYSLGFPVTEGSESVTLNAVAAMQGNVTGVMSWLNHLVWCRDDVAAVQVESFVVSRRATRSLAAKAGQTTREVLDQVKAYAFHAHVPVYSVNASAVKTWATDERLQAAGCLVPTKGMPHARDAARHALFRAVNSYGLPDPLSKRWKQ